MFQHFPFLKNVANVNVTNANVANANVANTPLNEAKVEPKACII